MILFTEMKKKNRNSRGLEEVSQLSQFGPAMLETALDFHMELQSN